MIKLLQPANNIVQQKKQQLEGGKERPQPDQGFINDKNYHDYCIMLYDFFKMNSETIKVMTQVETYIERGEGRE